MEQGLCTLCFCVTLAGTCYDWSDLAHLACSRLGWVSVTLLFLGGCSILFDATQAPADASTVQDADARQTGDARESDASAPPTFTFSLGAIGPNAGQVSISNQEGIFCNLPLCEFSFPVGSALQLYASPPAEFTSWELLGTCATTTNQNTAIVPLTADCGAIASFGSSVK
jgi:hypothetical protein